jgi:hypothetical protein
LAGSDDPHGLPRQRLIVCFHRIVFHFRR